MWGTGGEVGEWEEKGYNWGRYASKDKGEGVMDGT